MKAKRVRNKAALERIVQPGADPEALRADLERRRSSAASKHDARPRRQRSRRDARRAAVSEW
jgi:hypothetical protein